MLPYIIHHHVLFQLNQIKLEFQWVYEMIHLVHKTLNIFVSSV